MSFPAFTFDPITIQELAEKPIASKAEARKEIFNLTSPYNFYIRVEDLKDGDRYLYFYAWSLGKIKNVIWGYFDLAEDAFFVEGECGYTGLNQIIAINRYMESQGFVMVFNIVESWMYKVFVRDAEESTKKPESGQNDESFLQKDIKTSTEDPKADSKAIPINQYDIDLSLISDSPKQIETYRKLLSIVADRFLRTIEKSEIYAIKTIEQKCTDPSYCLQKGFLNFLMQDLDSEDFSRCSLYYNGAPELRKSQTYHLYTNPIDFSKEPQMQ